VFSIKVIDVMVGLFPSARHLSAKFCMALTLYETSTERSTRGSACVGAPESGTV